MKSMHEKRNPEIVRRKTVIAKPGPRGDSRSKRLVGIGMYDSGVSDLGSNKKYMEGFGKKSMGRKKTAI
jgi:hypothetical protein